MAEQDQAPPTFVHNPNAPEVYAVEAFGFFLNSGNLHITFTTPRVDHATKSVARVVVGTLVMPIGGAQAMVTGLYNFLKERGLDPAPTPPKDQLQ